MVTPKDITEAAVGLRGVARRTPLLFVEELGVHLKLENEQPIGAFKIRGAYNAIRKLPDRARQRGVITYSSGNHGQAVAYAAKQFGVRAVVTMPETAPAVKVEGVKKWGGEVVFAGRTSEDRRIEAEAIAARDGLAIVPPFDHPDIVAGQATVALEIVEQLPAVEAVVVPVGGGGLISGVVAGLAAAQSRAVGCRDDRRRDDGRRAPLEIDGAHRERRQRGSRAARGLRCHPRRLPRRACSSPTTTSRWSVP